MKIRTRDVGYIISIVLILFGIYFLVHSVQVDTYHGGMIYHDLKYFSLVEQILGFMFFAMGLVLNVMERIHEHIRL